LSLQQNQRPLIRLGTKFEHLKILVQSGLLNESFYLIMMGHFGLFPVLVQPLLFTLQIKNLFIAYCTLYPVVKLLFFL